ncbi:hypothetical protein TYRP_006209, partial [Tyrophagus putrescentiae]
RYFGFPKPEELEPSCNYGCLDSAFKNCVTDTLKPAHPNNFKDRPVKSPCCSIAEYRICLDKAKNIDRIALIKSNVNTKLIFHASMPMRRNTAACTAPKSPIGADNMEICEKILFIFVL